MAVTWLTPSDIGLATTGSWNDVDVSASVPVGATGVILHFHNKTIYELAYGLRKKGSTDNRTHTMNRTSHLWAMVGVDSNRVFQAYIADTDEDIYLVGYTTDEAVFFDNGIEKTGTASSWVDIDISANTGGDTAKGVILEIVNDDSSNRNFGVRKNGSTDIPIALIQNGAHVWAFIGVDDSEIFEFYCDNVGVKVYIIGYFTKDVVFLTNAINMMSLTSSNTWQDLPSLPSNATGGFIEVLDESITCTYGLRKNGSTENIVAYCTRHYWGAVECDENQLIEGRTDRLSNTVLLLTGYTTEGAEAVVYEEPLLTEATASDSMTDLQAYVESLLTEVVSESSARAPLVTLLTEVTTTSTVTDIATYVEAVVTVGVSDSSTSEIQSYIESLLSELVSTSTLTDCQKYTESLLTSITCTVTQSTTMPETLSDSAKCTVTVADGKHTIYNVITFTLTAVDTIPYTLTAVDSIPYSLTAVDTIPYILKVGG